MLAVARLRRGLAPALLAVHPLTAGRPGAVRSRLAARTVMARTLVLAVLTLLALAVLVLLVLALLVLRMLLVLAMVRRLRGGGGRDRERERGNDDLHFKSPEKE